MKIVCASSVLFGGEAFASLGEVSVVPEQQISPAIVSCADALVTRSKTHICEHLLTGSRVRFAGTATAGMDHMDLPYLQKAGIATVSAPGCNATSVAEYVIVALVYLAEHYGLTLAGMTLGVIGVGQIGSRLARMAEVLGLEVLRNDPPLAAASNDPQYRPLEEVLQHADILTFHVPLAHEGPHPTWHMADCKFFARVKPGCIIINASRGEVIDSDSLALVIERGVVRHVVLDVWEHEPRFNHELLAHIDIGTPHIAGYSTDGKLAGTLQVYHEACHFFEVEPCWTPPALPPPAHPEIRLDARGKRDEESLWELTRQVYDITADDRRLREVVSDDPVARGAGFVRLRRDYPVRREFSSTSVSLVNAGQDLVDKIAGLGFAGLYPDISAGRFR
ncbi:MAG: 4-phosphoerythronate dehydrogenase [Spartobacteria bacterium]|nr:4-phosphoerythronate dehydrogenase [Spartobacteria bacterium]